jgi:GSH-dependent disulfide-bond oxidoreductase
VIDLYTWGTPNGWKASIMLEETGLDYRVRAVDIRTGPPYDPTFVMASPAAKIPAIVDADGPGGRPFAVFESSAILIYLAEKSASPLLPTLSHHRHAAMQWLMFTTGGVGPLFAQAFHFLNSAPHDVPYAKTRFVNETRRLYGVMEKRLGAAPFLAGPTYTIADVATFPHVSRHSRHGIDLADFVHVRRWYGTIRARPAVGKGMAVPGGMGPITGKGRD